MNPINDGHTIDLVIHGGGIHVKVTCPFKGQPYDPDKMKCGTADMPGDLVSDPCAVTEAVDDYGVECFVDAKIPFTVESVPIKIEYWWEGQYEDTEFWVRPLK